MANPFIELSYRFSCALDNRRDRKICGKELGEFVPSPFSESHGATGSQSASYPGLEVVLKDLTLTPEDSFIDIGCGKGRVLAYLISCGCPCRITGVELNPSVAYVARSWASRFPNVEIIEGNAMELDYNDYTVLFMYRPMESDAFIGFIELLEETLNHEIRLYYYADGQSGYYLNERPGWTLLERQEIVKARGRYIHKVPQRYSVWDFKPLGI